MGLNQTRAPGEVRDALRAVFRDNDDREMSVTEIIKLVEGRLGGTVAPSSVRSYLQIGSAGQWERCERRGYYRAR